MPELQEKKAAANKEPVEIKCSECDVAFRLWIPAERLVEWEKGSRISCVKCGAKFFLVWNGETFEVTHLSELAKKAAQKTAEAKAAETPAREARQAVSAAPAPPVQVKVPEPPRQEPAREAAQAANAETILVIEDDRLSRDMVENTLAQLGFAIIPVKSSTEAIRAAKQQNIQLIVTDLYLKNPADSESLLDGEELLVRLRDSGVSAPAIITTGKDIIDDLVLDPKWFELNVKGFIQKGNPFWVEELKLKVKEVLYKG